MTLEHIRSLEPQTRPNRVKESPAPRVHAGSKKARLAWREGLALFVAAYREAAELLKKGFRDAPFPEGCFPPGQREVRSELLDKAGALGKSGALIAAYPINMGDWLREDDARDP